MKTPLAKRLVLVLMVFTFVITAVACSGGSDPTSPKPDTTPSSQPSSPVTSDPGSSDSDNVVLPDIDYDYEFLICGIEDANYPSAALFADELNDEAINDAVYERNAKIEEVLGVTISGDLVKNVYKTANENISSGFNTYDMYMVPLDKAMTLAKDDYLVDLNELEWLDLDKPWWDQNCNESLALGDKLYTTTGDIDILDEELCFVIIFNKTKASEFHIDPYALVESGDWTIDKLLEFQTIMNIDLVDDTVKDYNDQWALLSAANTSTIFYWAAGERLIVRDENGMPTLGVNLTRAQNVISKVLDFMVDSEVITSNQISNWAGSDAWQIQLDMIMDGRAVFRSTVLKVARDMRDMENMIFGILPNPGIKPRFPALPVDSLPAEPKGSPKILKWIAYPFSSGSSLRAG